MRGFKHKNVAAELLEKPLKVRSKRNLVQSRFFSEKLKKTLNAYHNRAISTLEVLEELIKLARELDAAAKRGIDLGLTDNEVALTPSLPLSRAAPSLSRCLSRSRPPRLGSTTPSPPTNQLSLRWATTNSNSSPPN